MDLESRESRIRANALHCAARIGDFELCISMLERPLPIDLTGPIVNHVLTPLYYAATHRQHRMVALLLERGLDIDAKDCYGRTALHWAAHWANVRAIETLISHGASLDTRDTYGYTPLGLAIACRRGQAIEMPLTTQIENTLCVEQTNKPVN